MKKKVSLRRVFDRLSMRKKMQYSFLLPSLFVVTLALAGMGAVFEEMYRKQLLYGIEQSLAQADAFIDSYLMGMLYVSTQLKEDDALREILSEKDFGKKNDDAEIYREYYRLNRALTFLESGNPRYRIGIYLPDTISYSENRFHIYPLSDLEEALPGEEAMSLLWENRPYFLVRKENTKRSGALHSSYLTLLRRYDDEGEDSPVLQVQLDIRHVEDILKSARNIEGSRIFLRKEKEVLLSSSGEDFLSDLDLGQAKSGDLLTHEGKSYFFISRNLSFSGWELFGLIPLSGFRRRSALVFWLAVVLIFVSILLIARIADFLSRHYVGRIHTLNQKMLEISKGHLVIPTDPRLQEGDELDALDIRFDYMMQEVLRLMKEQYRLGRKISETQLRALQAQINPHFLYNTLDLINWGALDYGAEPVAKIARDLGEFYRLSLNHGSSVISIEDELRHVESFVRIENVHYEEAISLSVEVPESLRSFACLNILLQPFVENSIVHGIARHADIKKMNIRIFAVREKEDIRFIIEDDGPGINPEEIQNLLVDARLSASRGFGINNVNFRLKLCYGERYGICYRRLPKGTRVEILIRALDEAALLKLLA